jgi:hypothetical protein
MDRAIRLARRRRRGRHHPAERQDSPESDHHHGPPGVTWSPFTSNPSTNASITRAGASAPHSPQSPLAAAPPDLPLPDLPSVKGFARSKADFDNWYGLPTGAFVARPWPNGPDNERLARTDLNLLHPATAWPDRQMTPRELKRARAAYMKSLPTKHIDYWPLLQDVESLAMPFYKKLKLLRDRDSDTAIDDDADRDWT